MDADFFDLEILWSELVALLLLVDENLVTRVDCDESNLDVVDEDNEADPFFIELKEIDGEIVGFLLLAEVVDESLVLVLAEDNIDFEEVYAVFIQFAVNFKRATFMTYLMSIIA